MTTWADESLTGVWLGDDGAVYYARHHGATIWWAGLSADSPLGADEFHLGVRFANVFRGRLIGDAIIGEWADTPRGDMPQNGVIDLSVRSAAEMRVIRQFGAFGGSAWRRVAGPERGSTYGRTSVVHGVVVAEPALDGGDITFAIRREETNLPLRCRISGRTDSNRLPGWQERDGNSVLFRNGRPINGDVVVAADGSVAIMGRTITLGLDLRLTGFLSEQQEDLLCPVYSLDIVEPVARGTLTGTWMADDNGTYYLRQVGSTLWWLGLSHDQGRSFGNVFTGVLTQRGTEIEVNGDLVDLPLGARREAGRLTLRSSDGTILTTNEEPIRRWRKMSDTA